MLCQNHLEKYKGNIINILHTPTTIATGYNEIDWFERQNSTYWIPKLSFRLFHEVIPLSSDYESSFATFWISFVPDLENICVAQILHVTSSVSFCEKLWQISGDQTSVDEPPIFQDYIL